MLAGQMTPHIVEVCSTDNTTPPVTTYQAPFPEIIILLYLNI